MTCREETAGDGGGKCPLLADSEPRHRLGQISSGVERREKKGRRRHVRLKGQRGARRAQILRLAPRRRTELPGTGLLSSQKCTAEYSSVYCYHPRSLEPGETAQWSGPEFSSWLPGQMAHRANGFFCPSLPPALTYTDIYTEYN